VYNSFFGLGVSNVREQNTRRFVARVLGDELALEGAFQDCLSQPLGALQVGLFRGTPSFDSNHQNRIHTVTAGGADTPTVKIGGPSTAAVLPHADSA
jgi:hypothetical protein